MPNQIYLIIALLLVLGLVLLWMGFRRLLGHRRMFSGTFNTLLGALLISLAVGVVGVLANLYTYQQLTREQPVGDIHFTRWGTQQYVATLTLADNTAAVPLEFSLLGDEAQLDARILKWKGIGNLLGFETLYRLERLGGRYRNVADETGKERTVYALAENPGIEIWSLVNQYQQWLPWVDATYGNAVYLPMAHDAVYSLSMSNSGLVARPGNDSAGAVLRDWH
jgi:hypothetical protein